MLSFYNARQLLDGVLDGGDLCKFSLCSTVDVNNNDGYISLTSGSMAGVVLGTALGVIVVAAAVVGGFLIVKGRCSRDEHPYNVQE
jgi:hypothetical protein